VVEAEMLLEGGIFVKTCSGLWKPLAGCAGRASTSDLEKPTSCIRKSVKFSGFNLMFLKLWKIFSVSFFFFL